MWSKLESNLQRVTSKYSKPRMNCPPDPESELQRIRIMVKVEGYELQRRITELWSENMTFALEMDLVVNTITYAILNPRATGWDLSRFAVRVKNSKVSADGKVSEADSRLDMYFEQAAFGDLTEPTSILDQYGRIMVWALTDVLHPNRLEDFNNASSGIGVLLKRGRFRKPSQGSGKSTAWRSSHFKTPDTVPPLFEPGMADFSPGWFMQRCERLQDQLHVSQDLRTPLGRAFLEAMQQAETLVDCIAVLVCPKLYAVAGEAIVKLKQGECLSSWHDNVGLWPSIYSGIEVIANRVTPLHRDSKAAAPVYDILVSAGTHTHAWFDVPDIKTRLSYGPGTVLALCGKVLRHGVESWVGGERLCMAHFIRDAVHDRLQLPYPGWVTNSDYIALMDRGLVDRQKWAVHK